MIRSNIFVCILCWLLLAGVQDWSGPVGQEEGGNDDDDDDEVLIVH